MSPTIFINYRRSDSPPLGMAVSMALKAAFGSDQVFVDEDIEGGELWRNAIRDALQQTQLLVVTIGDDWLEAKGRSGHSLSDVDDWVRFEIEHALRAGKPVLPIQLGKRLPDAKSLPEPIRGLFNQQAVRMCEETWTRDVDRLVSRVAKITGLRPGGRLRRFAHASLLLAVGLALGAGGAVLTPWLLGPPPPPVAAADVVTRGGKLIDDLVPGSREHAWVIEAIGVAEAARDPNRAGELLALLRPVASASSRWAPFLDALEKLAAEGSSTND